MIESNNLASNNTKQILWPLITLAFRRCLSIIWVVLVQATVLISQTQKFLVLLLQFIQQVGIGILEFAKNLIYLIIFGLQSYAPTRIIKEPETEVNSMDLASRHKFRERFSS